MEDPKPTQQSTAIPASDQNISTAAIGDNISLSRAFISLVVILLILISGGYALGKYKFWRTYDTTSYADRMEALYTQKAKDDPNNPDNYIQLGYTYFQKQKYDQAISCYQKALALDDKNYQAHYNLGLAFDASGKKDRAIQEFQKAINIAPKAQPAHLSLGMLYLAKGTYDKAESELNKAYEANPGDAQLLYNLGLAKEKLGKKDDAIQAYQASLDLMPTNTAAKQALQRLQSNKK